MVLVFVILAHGRTWWHRKSSVRWVNIENHIEPHQTSKSSALRDGSLEQILQEKDLRERDWDLSGAELDDEVFKTTNLIALAG